MGRIVVTEFISLDGVIEDPGGAEDFEHGGWTFEYDRGDDGNTFKLDELMGADVTLLGRVVSLEDDPDLAGIDRLSLRYYGEPFHSRDARRVTAWVEPDRWTAWPLPR